MRELSVEHLAREHGLFFCVECGKCTSVCPMAKLFDDFSYDASPRGVIERALLDSTLEDEPDFWLCLTCDLCTDLCPQGVRFRDFMLALRESLGTGEHGASCRVCGSYVWPRHTVEHMKRALGDAAESHLTLCPRCRRHDVGARLRTLR